MYYGFPSVVGICFLTIGVLNFSFLTLDPSTSSMVNLFAEPNFLLEFFIIGLLFPSGLKFWFFSGLKEIVFSLTSTSSKKLCDSMKVSD